LILNEKYEIPPNWVWTTFNEFAEINPKLPFNQLSDDFEVSFIPMSHVQEESGMINLELIKKYKDVKKGFTDFIDGDIIFAKITPCMENGKIAIVKNLHNKIGFGSTEFHVIRLPTNINNKFYFYFVSQDWFRKLAGKNFTGTVGQRRVPTDFMKHVLVPLPPYNEQVRIVSKIDELFSNLDVSLNILKKGRFQLNQYCNATLKYAFNGKLTEGWRKRHRDQIEPALRSLERFRLERQKNWEEDPRHLKSDVREKRFKEDTSANIENLPSLPIEWTYANADELSVQITDGEHITPRRQENGVFLLSARNVRDGHLSVEKVDFISNDEYERIRKRLNPEPGDVLLSCSGSIGRTCVVPENIKFSMVRSVALLKPRKELVSGKYMSLALRSDILQSQINRKKTQTAQANIFQGKIKTLTFPLAPFQEQGHVVHEIERRFSVADDIEKIIEQISARAVRMRKIILKRAFEGRLISQDTNESASVLLEKIKAETTVIGKPSMRGRKSMN